MMRRVGISWRPSGDQAATGSPAQTRAISPLDSARENSFWIFEAAVEGIDRRLVGRAGKTPSASAAIGLRRCRQSRRGGIGNGMSPEGYRRQAEGSRGRVHGQRDRAPGIQRNRPGRFNRGFACAGPDPAAQGERRCELELQATPAGVAAGHDDLAARHLQRRMKTNRERAVRGGLQHAADPGHGISAGRHSLRPRLGEGRHGQRMKRAEDHAADRGLASAQITRTTSAWTRSPAALAT